LTRPHNAVLFQMHSNFEEFSRENYTNQGVSPSTARKSFVITHAHTHTKRAFKAKNILNISFKDSKFGHHHLKTFFS